MTTAKDDTIAAGGFDARKLLVVFVRLMAAFWFFRGLAEWARLLDLAGPGGYTELALDQQIGIAVFAVVDLVAAVGLWLVASWGAVVWLALAVAEVLLYGAFAGDFGFRPALIAFHIVTVLAYGVMTRVVERKG